MEVTTLCFRLFMLELILLGTQVYTQKPGADFPRITPNRLQHFNFESVSFDCGGFDGSTQLRVFKNNQEFDSECEINRTSTGSFCKIDRIYLEDSGEYWCETNGRDRSNSVNITVTDGSVILESPVLPVMEGDTVTLRCRGKIDSTDLRADFYKNGILVKSSPTEEMTINNVSKSDEGRYKCNISGLGKSPESWLAVKGNSIIPPSTPQDDLSDDFYAPHVLVPLWVSVAIIMMVLALLLMGFLHFRKHRDTGNQLPRHIFSKTQKAAASCSVNVADNPSNAVYAAVVPKQRKSKDTADAADNLSPCLERNHSRKAPGRKDEDESSFQPFYSTLTISEAP